jgi:hypothetical protein
MILSLVWPTTARLTWRPNESFTNSTIAYLCPQSVFGEFLHPPGTTAMHLCFIYWSPLAFSQRCANERLKHHHAGHKGGIPLSCNLPSQYYATLHNRSNNLFLRCGPSYWNQVCLLLRPRSQAEPRRDFPIDMGGSLPSMSQSHAQLLQVNATINNSNTGHSLKEHLRQSSPHIMQPGNTTAETRPPAIRGFGQPTGRIHACCRCVCACPPPSHAPRYLLGMCAGRPMVAIASRALPGPARPRLPRIPFCFWLDVFPNCISQKKASARSRGPRVRGPAPTGQD